MIIVQAIFGMFLFVIILLMTMNISECLLKLSQSIIREIKFHQRRFKASKVKLDLEKAINAATSKQLASANNHTQTIIYGGGYASGRPLTPNTNQNYNIGQTQNYAPPRGAHVTIQGQQNAFSPAISIIDKTKFDSNDAKEWLLLVNTKIEALETTIETETDESKKKELKLTLLTLKYLSVECERMLSQ